jgi:hypothetical protein
LPLPGVRGPPQVLGASAKRVRFDPLTAFLRWLLRMLDAILIQRTLYILAMQEQAESAADGTLRPRLIPPAPPL